MTTQINVTVGSGGLSDRAKQQQQAARQAQLEKERQQRVETQGQQQRTAKLEAAGKNPDGAPLYGTSSKEPEVDRRPAASRALTDSLLLKPKDPAYVVEGTTKVNLQSTGGFPKIANWLSSTPPNYLATGGPNGAPAFEIAPNPNGTGFNSEFEASYPKTPTTNGKTGVKAATLEFFIKFSPSFDVFSNPQSLFVTIGPNLFYVSIYLTWDTSPNVLICDIDASVKRGYFYSIQSIYQYGGPLADAPIQRGVWHHCAIIKSLTPSGSLINFCIDGVSLGSLAVDWQESIYGLSFPGEYRSNWLEIGIGTDGGSFPNSAQPMYIHGVRFLPRSVYVPPFTPPLNL
ncbi:MAG: hypothetical protein ACO3GP_02690 [Candidatus Limnocylindrus sp.]